MKTRQSIQSAYRESEGVGKRDEVSIKKDFLPAQTIMANPTALICITEWPIAV